MPRDVVAVTATAVEATTATPAGVTINPANGATLAAIGDGRRAVVRVTNTHSGDHTVTFKRARPEWVEDDLTITIPKESDQLLSLELARHAQRDGTIDVDYEVGMTGAISVIQLPGRGR